MLKGGGKNCSLISLIQLFQVYVVKRISLYTGFFIVVGPSQSAPGQYPNYPQGQGQQYGTYRPPQPGPPQGQQQRPYGYDQVSIPTTPDSHRDLHIHLS